jgi:carboxymethylenebutenolidase
VPKAAQEKIRAGLKGHPQVTIHVYEGNDHAFARVGGQHYDAQAAKTANDRSAAFFKQHLS